jgi:hypothetical protein
VPNKTKQNSMEPVWRCFVATDEPVPNVWSKLSSALPMLKTAESKSNPPKPPPEEAADHSDSKQQTANSKLSHAAGCLFQGVVRWATLPGPEASHAGDTT